MTLPPGFFLPGTQAPAIPVQPGGSSPPGSGFQPPATLPLSPFDYAPPNSTPIFLDDQATPGAGPVVVTPAGLVLTLNKITVGVIKELEMLVDGAGISVATVVNFIIRVNGNPVPLLGRPSWTLVGRTGVNNVSRIIRPLSIVIPPSGTVDMQISVVDVGAYTVAAQLVGWSWPITT